MDFVSSSKAPYRPGKAPAKMARTASLISLPSPPSDCDDLPLDHRFNEDGMDIDGGLDEAPRRPTFVPSRGFEADEEVDQLDSDTEDEGETREVERASSPSAMPVKRRASALGSPANLVGGGGASRRQLLNPFLPAPVASTSTSSHQASSLFASTSPTRPDFLHASPTRRRRADPDRIRLASAITPPRRTREELAEERARQEEEEAKQRKRTMMGWDDPENPFVEREGEMAARLEKQQKPMKRPETITLVKRGQRISTSVPFTAVLTSSSADEDPFTFTAPKLLFPPKSSSASIPHPSTPPQPSKFLEALRAAGARPSEARQAPAPVENKGGVDQLPPTPVTLKRKPTDPALQAGQGRTYKKMKGALAEGGLR